MTASVARVPSHSPCGRLRFSMLFPLFVLVVATVPGGATAQAQSNPCPRSAPRSFPVGSEVVVDARETPCRIVFRPTGVRLEPVADGSRPDPGRSVVRDGMGRYYSANARGFLTNISVWGPDGAFLTHFGGTGEGPGEFPGTGSILAIYVDGHDQLHVWAPGSWSVFSADQKFLRRYPTPAARLLNRETVAAVLDDGTVLTASGHSDGKNFFRILRPDGSHLQSFGPVDPEIVWDEYQPPEKLISYSGDETFWAAANRPLTEGWEGWVAEEWALDGEHRRTFRRRVPGYEMFEANGNVSGATAFMHVDGDGGLLYVVFAEITPRGRERAKDPARITPEERRSGLFTARVEMLDLRSGELLASHVYPVDAELETFMPWGAFLGTMEGYVYKETEAGLPVVEIVAIELVAK